MRNDWGIIKNNLTVLAPPKAATFTFYITEGNEMLALHSILSCLALVCVFQSQQKKTCWASWITHVNKQLEMCVDVQVDSCSFFCWIANETSVSLLNLAQCLWCRGINVTFLNSFVVLRHEIIWLFYYYKYES